MRAERLKVFSTACFSITLVLVLCSSPSFSVSFSWQEVRQLIELNKLARLEEDVLLTCNLAFFPALTDYRTAEENCQKFVMGTGQGGQLAKILNEKRNKQVARLLELAYPINEQPKYRWALTRWVWVGLRRKSNTGKIVAGVYDRGQWEYADGSHPGEYQSWMPKQPDNRTLAPGEMRMGELGCYGESACCEQYLKVDHDGLWDDSFDFLTHPYVCEYQGKYMVSGEHKTWEEANEACKEAGLEFAKIRSDDELAELVRAVEYFLGATTEIEKWDDSNWAWIGGHEEWLWADGETIKWDIKWEPKGRNGSAAKFQHMAISRWGTVDDSYNGMTKSRPFACQCPEVLR